MSVLDAQTTPILLPGDLVDFRESRWQQPMGHPPSRVDTSNVVRIVVAAAAHKTGVVAGRQINDDQSVEECRAWYVDFDSIINHIPAPGERWRLVRGITGGERVEQATETLRPPKSFALGETQVRIFDSRTQLEEHIREYTKSK